MFKYLLFSTALLFPAAAVSAPIGVTLSADKAITTFQSGQRKPMLPNWSPPKGKTKIFDTLGKADAYNSSSGWTISSAGSEAGAQQWFAFAITPAADATVTEIVEAVTNVAGTNSVTIALLADNNGIPGAVLEEKEVKNLDTFGNCCTVAVDKFKTGVQVTAGSTYWVAAILPKKKQSTTWDAWNYSSVNTDSGTAAFYNGGWTSVPSEYSAFAVYGD
jgi:hypothetical protein